MAYDCSVIPVSSLSRRKIGPGFATDAPARRAARRNALWRERRPETRREAAEHRANGRTCAIKRVVQSLRKRRGDPGASETSFKRGRPRASRTELGIETK